ncbi:MAG TPA: NRDE family protein [Pseudomonadales bacterium]
MCLIVLAYRIHPDYPLIVAANRDEFYARPTQAAGFWAEHPDLLAGRDEQSGGTWLGITRSGRFAAVTNVRRGGMVNTGLRSRGQLVCDFLTGNANALAFSETVARDAHHYGAFNLLTWDGDNLIAHHSLSNDSELLEPGIHGLSNDRLNTPWPKLTRSLNALRACIDDNPSPEALFGVLRDTTRPADHELPDTGIGLKQEQLLGSPFIRSADYGTRACTVLRVHRSGRVDFHEQTFDAQGIQGAEVHETFSVPGD